MIISSLPAVEYGPLYYRDAEIEKNQALKEANGNFDKNMVISPEMKKELSWWLEHVESQKRENQRNTPDVILKSDASLESWVLVVGNNKTGGRWTPTEQENHINCLGYIICIKIL